MDFYQIRYFLAVAETGNFSRAAERVHVSQPTLSAGIRKLEEELGRPLFERGRRRSALTADGQRFLDHARTIQEEITAAKEAVAGHSHDGIFRLGLMKTLPSAGIARLLLEFRQAAGRVRLQVQEGKAEQLRTWLEQDRLDAAITILQNPPPPEEVIETRPLFTSRQYVAMAPEHPLAQRSEITLSDFQDLPTIVRINCEFYRNSRRLFDARNIRPHIVMRTTRDDQAIEMALAGLGVTLLPDRLARPGLVLLPAPELRMSHEIGLLTARRNNPSAALFRIFATSHNWLEESLIKDARTPRRR